jgi:hypothetical protein
VENMTDSNLRQEGGNQPELESWRGSENDPLDCELDAALARYTAVEPRTGLEQRILANLESAQERAAARVWWRWPALAAVAAVIVIAVSLAWKSGRTVQKVTVHPPSTIRRTKDDGTQAANRGGSGPIHPHPAPSGIRLKPHPVSDSATSIASASAPKLEQFPSPHPLSEQEGILAGYITKYPENAALIAQARTEALQEDIAEQAEEAARAGHEDSQQRNK